MAEGEQPKEFPDVNHKLAAPKKLSTFEKERQAAHAKEKRAEAENAAALKAFEDSFAYDKGDDDDDELSQLTAGRGPPSGPRAPAYGQEQHGGRYGMPPGPRSGPGSLGSLPGAPPPSLKRKRALDELREAQEARREQQELLAMDDSRSDSVGTPQQMAHDEEPEIDAPRPTIHLSSLPPATTTNDVKTLLKDHLNVYSVRFLPPAGPGSNSKRSVSAIVTLAEDTSNVQIDSSISALKDKYLSCGFCLAIARHLSSAAMHPSMSANPTTMSYEAFGAESQKEQPARFSMRNAPPPKDHRGFAPPESYDSPARLNYDNGAQPHASVNVQPPLSIDTVKAIHTVVDALLLEPHPERALEMEAMLMSLPHVQSDPRFSFLYDSRSPAGIYYRYLLWMPEGPYEEARAMKQRARDPERVYEDVAIDWVPPRSRLPFPDLQSLEQVVDDIDYDSSEEESDDDEEERQFNRSREGDGLAEKDEPTYLSPLQKARLVFLLSRLPFNNAKLRKGDVARVTNFAINHAGAGAEEIVDLLLFNVERPLSSSLAATYEDSETEQDEEDVYEPDEDLSNLDSPAPPIKDSNKRDEDPTNAKLIALYVISDILSASSTAGARNAWKYRQLFEAGFKHRKTFEYLGKLDRELSMGRMKAEQWKRKIGVVFGIWESWSVFSPNVHEEFKQSFFEPPLSAEEKAAAQAEAEREEKKKVDEKLIGKFKKVEQGGSPSAASASPAPAPDQGAKHEHNHRNGSPMAKPNGVPMDHDETDRRPMLGLDGASDTTPAAAKTTPGDGKPSGPRRRMRAEDMFADSDGE